MMRLIDMARAAAVALVTGAMSCGVDAPSREAEQSPQALGEAGGIITSVSLSSTGGQSLASYMTHHPVKASITILPTVGVVEHRVMIGLVEKESPSLPKAQVRTCPVADFTASYGVAPGETAELIALVHEAVIPEACLAGASPSGTFNLWVAIDPLMEGDDPSSASYNTQFFNAAGIDMNGADRNHLCAGPNGEVACVQDITVTSSGGYDVEATVVEPESSIGVVWSKCAADPARPMFSVNGQLRVFGEAAYDPKDPEGDMRNALTTAGGPVAVRYSLCPRDASGGCVPGTTYADLAVGKALDDHVTIDRLGAAEPLSFNHDVRPAPESEACGRLRGSQGALENWKTYGAYNLRMCVAAPFPQAGNGDAAANDCVVTPVQITQSSGGGASQASSKQFKKVYDKYLGNSVINATFSLGTDNNVDLNGATSKSWARGNAGGWFSFNLFDVGAEAAAYVALVGSYMEFHVQVFGIQLYQYKKAFQNPYTKKLTFTQGKSFSKEKCLTYNYGIAGLGLNLQGCVEGSIGAEVELVLAAQYGDGEGPFDTSTKTGVATVTFGPVASLELSASAYADILVLRGGITGKLTLVELGLPISASLQWGLKDGPSLVVVATGSIDLEINTLKGHIDVWVDIRKPNWCSCGSWCPGYPCFDWGSLVRQRLFSWPGFTYTINLWNWSGTYLLFGPAVCGDAIKSSGEACDDGNTQSGDGCSASCAVEPGYTCANATGQPSTCTQVGCGGKPNGAMCSDGDACTINDSCQGGTCGGTPALGGILFETRPYTSTCMSASFTSTSSIATVPASPLLNFGPGSSFSGALWAKLAPGVTQHFLVKGDNSSNEWSLSYGGGKVCFNRQGIANLVCYTPASLGSFRHYAFTYNGAGNGTIKLYEDGVLKGAGSGKVGNAASTTLKVGNYAAGQANLSGQIDDLALWSKTLSDAEVQALFARSKTPATVGSLVAQWPLNEGSGTTSADSSGNGLTMTLSSTSWSGTCAFTNPTSTAQAIGAWNGLPTGVAGYGSAGVTSLASFSNQSNFGGSAFNVAYHFKVGVGVSSSQAGTWGFRVGGDFGYGATLVVDGVELQARWSDMWWAGGFSDPSQYLTGTVSLAEGFHTVEVYGFEGGADGAGQMQFTVPGSSTWTSITTAALQTCPSAPASCKALKTANPGAASGAYTLDPDGAGPVAPFSAYCDMSTDSGGWTLVLAYGHVGGQNAALVPGVPPQNPTAGYSHMSMAQMQSLGTIAEMRLYCQTSTHARKIHFKSNNAGLLAYLRGTGANALSYWQSGVTALSGHTAFLPNAVDSVFSQAGEDRMTNFPFYTAYYYHWGIQGVGNRWECDDFPGDASATTLHQIWAR